MSGSRQAIREPQGCVARYRQKNPDAPQGSNRQKLLRGIYSPKEQGDACHRFPQSHLPLSRYENCSRSYAVLGNGGDCRGAPVRRGSANRCCLSHQSQRPERYSETTVAASGHITCVSGASPTETDWRLNCMFFYMTPAQLGVPFVPLSNIGLDEPKTHVFTLSSLWVIFKVLGKLGLIHTAAGKTQRISKSPHRPPCMRWTRNRGAAGAAA